jgi:hypothetical protein
VRRPLAARKALGLSPLVKAGWADASGVESVPLITAGAEPFVFFAGETNRRAGSGYAAVLIFPASSLSQARGLERQADCR